LTEKKFYAFWSIKNLFEPNICWKVEMESMS